MSFGSVEWVKWRREKVKKVFLVVNIRYYRQDAFLYIFSNYKSNLHEESNNFLGTSSSFKEFLILAIIFTKITRTYFKNKDYL